ncbi:hypothetical protein A2686_03230 [Candidatus Woesebacteria bacterium RIFCSPHIGHO2_01_FULL_38_10]|nr:MAG: hypothetical protein A2686_03230 [Candidatus Woesebacteria bacterium RIFCSPHIGHO2_01_FULL_38_10]
MRGQDIKGKALKVWKSKYYYQLAKEGSLNKSHFGIKVLEKLAENSSCILDLGCGEGTRLSIIAKGKKGVGVDISRTAIGLARRTYSNLTFKRANLENLPFEDDSFDLVYCAFVLEHLTNPEKVIREAIRVTRKGGYLVFAAPNYGAPNRASPVFKGSRVSKFFKGLLGDLVYPFSNSFSLLWNEVQPMENPKEHESDYDTSIEPYIGTLIPFSKSFGLSVKVWSVCWEEEKKDVKIQQRLFRFLAEKGIFPFTLWGPHLVLVLQK